MLVLPLAGAKAPALHRKRKTPYPAAQPPSTGSDAPVMSVLSDPQRKSISAATLSAETKRPVGCFPERNRCAASARDIPALAIIDWIVASCTGDSVVPGQSALQVMLSATVSSATAR